MPLPAYVAPNELIESSWGNLVVDGLKSHDDKLAQGGPFVFNIFPAANNDATTSASFTTWLQAANVVTVPTWATIAVIEVAVNNVASITATSTYAFDIMLTGGSYGGDRSAIYFAGAGDAGGFGIIREVPAPEPGVVSVLLGARRNAGTGQIRASAATKVNGKVTFR